MTLKKIRKPADIGGYTYLKQILIDIKGETDNVVGDFNTLIYINVQDHPDKLKRATGSILVSS